MLITSADSTDLYCYEPILGISYSYKRGESIVECHMLIGKVVPFHRNGIALLAFGMLLNNTLPYRQENFRFWIQELKLEALRMFIWFKTR